LKVKIQELNTEYRKVLIQKSKQFGIPVVRKEQDAAKKILAKMTVLFKDWYKKPTGQS
jgi:hypothetical protein